jgi:anti-sigma factor RsiW
VRCDELADVLAASGGDPELAGRDVRRHVGSCLRCQAEMAHYRRLLRALHTLRTEILAPPPGLVDDVLAGLEEAGERHALRALLGGRRAAYVGGLAVTAAAGGAAALVLASRGRRRLLAS